MSLYALTTLTLVFLDGHVLCHQDEQDLNYTFPEEFMIGAATAAYQIEGAWNVSGKGPSVWDTLTHNFPGYVADNTTGDEADLSYYLYKEDNEVIKEMGMKHYRFSIAWTRIMPTGLPNDINQEGIDHYNKVIDNTLEMGIIPMVTIFHWDTPQYLQDLGGWANEFTVKAYVEYARTLFKHFGDRVKWWITVNEPQIHCLAYEGKPFGTYNPNMTSPGVGTYLASKNLILAHAYAYRLYDKEFRASQNGKISFASQIPWFEPLDPNSAEDKEVADRAMKMVLGWFSEPVYGNGDFPQILKDRIQDLSNKEGFPWSRLPEFSPEEKQFVKGTYDFFALNHYGTILVTKATEGLLPQPSLLADMGINTTLPWWLPISPKSNWLSVSPVGFRRLLQFIKQQYGNFPIFITENGYSDNGELEDEMRMKYIGTYLTEMYKAMYIDEVDVIGYTVWSSIDNFEWGDGFEARFGLYYVNYTDPARHRIPKASSYMMKNITSTRRIPQKYVDLAANFSLDMRP